MRKHKFLAGLLLTAWSVSALPVAAYAEDTALQLIINNQLYLPTEGQAGPALVDERVYVPLRLVSESLGHQVQWLPSQRLVAIWTEEPANVVETDSGEVAAEDGPITITVDDTLLSADADTGQPYIAEEGTQWCRCGWLERRWTVMCSGRMVL